MKFKSKDLAKAIVDGNKVYGVSTGDTKLEAYDDNDTYLGSIPVEVKDVAGVPTGITLNKKTIEIGTSYDQSATIRATVTPSTANQGVTWKSADTSIAVVSAKGKVNSTRKGGETTVTATTVDGRLSASCKVIVIKQGIAVLSVTPNTVSLPEERQVVQFSYTKKIYGGIDEAVSVFCYGDLVRGQDKTGDSFKINFPRNYGSARTFEIEVSGTGNDEPPKMITATQDGSTVVKEILRYDHSRCDASGSFYFDNTGTCGLGLIDFSCATGYGETAVSNTSCDEWITIDKVTYDYGNPNPGGLSVYNAHIKCSANTTGSARTGHVTFPGNVVYTVYQDA